MSGILAMMTGGAPPDLVLNVTGLVNPNLNALASAWLGPAQKVRIVNTGNVNTLVIPAAFVPGAEVTLENAAGGLIGGAASGGHALTVRRAVRAIGWLQLCLGDNPEADRAHFLKIYDALRIRHQAEQENEAVLALSGAADLIRALAAGMRAK